jgi:UDP-N-acetyl-D-mannosaminuronic acid dehydrogenase
MFKKIVVVGMGYVGIPVAAEFANAGFDVVGIEILKWKVDWINEGKCPIQGNEPGLPELLKKVVKKGKLTATQDFSECKDADAILICTETPFDLKREEPNYSALKSATKSVSENLGKKSLIVVESTIAPKTMENVVKPILGKNGKKAGKDFYLANCPERVMPGRLLYNIENFDRVVGGIDKKSQELAVELYSHIVKGKLYPTDCLTAEIVKTTENAYRDVQIGFANEIALICEKLGVDVFRVRELVNKCPYRNMHLPGAGVGGHCLPKDSHLLAYSVKDKVESKMLRTAR